MTFTLELDKEQITIISEALAAMPYHRVFRIIAELQTQINPQIKQEQPNGNAKDDNPHLNG